MQKFLNWNCVERHRLPRARYRSVWRQVVAIYSRADRQLPRHRHQVHTPPWPRVTPAAGAAAAHAQCRATPWSRGPRVRGGSLARGHCSEEVRRRRKNMMKTMKTLQKIMKTGDTLGSGGRVDGARSGVLHFTGCHSSYQRCTLSACFV